MHPDGKDLSYMEKRLKEERVKNYIGNYYQRKQLFQQIVEGWSGLNEENKFLMNITEEDFSTFKENTIKKNHAATDRKPSRRKWLREINIIYLIPQWIE